MEKGKIALLKGDLDEQAKEIERIYSRIEERAKGKRRADIEGLSYWLHNLYCAFEDMFKIVAGAFENNIDDERRYHSELLKRMIVTIEGVRPAFLSDESFRLLDNLRAFRHLLRHAYMYDLDEKKVRLVFDDARRLEKIYKRDVKMFIAKLR